MAASPVSADEHNHGKHSHKEAHAHYMLEGYDVVANALHEDKLANIKPLVMQFLTAVESQTTLEKGA